MGALLRKLIEDYPTDERVVMIGTGGLSHQLQGSRAGFLNPEADKKWIDTIASDPEYWRGLSREEYVEMFCSEGAELIMWLLMRGCMDAKVDLKHSHYFSPESMTGAGCVVLESA